MKFWRAGAFGALVLAGCASQQTLVPQIQQGESEGKKTVTVAPASAACSRPQCPVLAAAWSAAKPAQAVLTVGLPHQAAWLDRETMEPRLCAIGDTEELTQALSGLLSAETEPDTRTVTRRLAETQGLDYAHAAVLSLRSELEDLTTASGTPVTHVAVSAAMLRSKEGIYLAL